MKSIITIILLSIASVLAQPKALPVPTIWLRWDSVVSAASYRVYERTAAGAILIAETTNTFVCIGDPLLATNEVKNPEPAAGFYARDAQNTPGFFRVASARFVTQRRSFVLYHVNPEGGESAPAGKLTFPFTVLQIPFGEWRLKHSKDLLTWTPGRVVNGTTRIGLFIDPRCEQEFLSYTNN